VDEEQFKGKVRIRINLTQREFEVEGSEVFVQSYAAQFAGLLTRLLEEPVSSASLSTHQSPTPVVHNASEATAGFGELYQYVPKTATDVDRILVAGYYVQRAGTDNCFTTAEVNELLTEHGVKVSNPSECVRRNISMKRVFLQQKGKYRVSQQGADYVRQLFSAAARSS
jgi:hypothetical protein